MANDSLKEAKHREDEDRERFEVIHQHFPSITLDVFAQIRQQERMAEQLINNAVDQRVAASKKKRGRPSRSASGVDFDYLKKCEAVIMGDRGESHRAIASFVHKTDHPSASQIRNISHQLKRWQKESWIRIKRS